MTCSTTEFGSMCFFFKFTFVIISRKDFFYFLLNVSTERIKENDDEVFEFKKIHFFL